MAPPAMALIRREEICSVNELKDIGVKVSVNYDFSGKDDGVAFEGR